jgi:maleate isomerase
MADTLTTEQVGGGLAVNKQHMAYELDDGVYARAAIGLIVLASDQTVEHEFRQIFTMPGVALYESRIYNDTNITPDTLKAMEAGLTEAADLIVPGIPLDVVAYGCTSGAMVIGDETVAARIHEARPGVACTSPMKGALAALAALGANRVALLTPYLDEINQTMRNFIEDKGVSVPVMGSFNEPDDNKVGRISPASIRKAALELGRSESVDAVFVSCTALRVVEIVADLEAELGKPVTSSNHAMAWHCLRLAGIDDPQPHLGRLFTRPLAG